MREPTGIHTYIHAYIHTYIHIIHTYTHIYIRTCVHLNMEDIEKGFPAAARAARARSTVFRAKDKHAKHPTPRKKIKAAQLTQLTWKLILKIVCASCWVLLHETNAAAWAILPCVLPSASTTNAVLVVANSCCKLTKTTCEGSSLLVLGRLVVLTPQCVFGRACQKADDFERYLVVSQYRHSCLFHRVSPNQSKIHLFKWVSSSCAQRLAAILLNDSRSATNCVVVCFLTDGFVPLPRVTAAQDPSWKQQLGFTGLPCCRAANKSCPACGHVVLQRPRQGS